MQQQMQRALKTLEGKDKDWPVTKWMAEAFFKVSDKAGALYDLNDLVFKVALYFKKTVGEGWSPEQAVEKVYYDFPNYNRMGPLAKWVRRSPGGAPFAGVRDRAGNRRGLRQARGMKLRYTRLAHDDLRSERGSLSGEPITGPV